MLQWFSLTERRQNDVIYQISEPSPDYFCRLDLAQPNQAGLCLCSLGHLVIIGSVSGLFIVRSQNCQLSIMSLMQLICNWLCSFVLHRVYLCICKQLELLILLLLKMPFNISWEYVVLHFTDMYIGLFRWVSLTGFETVSNCWKPTSDTFYDTIGTYF